MKVRSCQPIARAFVRLRASVGTRLLCHISLDASAAARLYPLLLFRSHSKAFSIRSRVEHQAGLPSNTLLREIKGTVDTVTAQLSYYNIRTVITSLHSILLQNYHLARIQLITSEGHGFSIIGLRDVFGSCFKYSTLQRLRRQWKMKRRLIRKSGWKPRADGNAGRRTL